MPSRKPGPRPAAKRDNSILLDRYVLEGVIGRGGMATVYRATDKVLGRPVAVKLLNAQLSRDPEFVQRFLDMERRIARLFHSHLVTIFDAGVAEQGCFVVMEYVGGGSLRDVLAREGALEVPRVAALVAQVADALHLLHSQGIVHGDVKPDNILLDDEGYAKLVDFGIAQLATTTGALKRDTLAGSTPYLAPEQLDQGLATARSDIYALGLVAYELLAGHGPFQGENWAAVAAQRLVRDPDPLRQARPDVPADLERVVMRALARHPEERFVSAEAFRQAIEPRSAQPALATAWGAEGPTESLPLSSGDEPPPPPVRTSAPFEGWRRWRRWPERVRLVKRAQSYRASLVALAARANLAERTERLDASLKALAARGRTAWRGSRLRDRLQRRDRPTLAALGALGLVAVLALALGVPRALNPPRPVSVPQLAGQRLAAARDLARQAGLGLAVSEQPSQTAESGLVLRQEPPPGTTIQSDQPVRLVVSSGPPPVHVPDLRRRRLEDARQDLAGAGLALGRVEEREVARQPWGVVIAQSAPAGSQVSPGSAVDVTVGVPPWTSVPRLVGRALGDAEAELERRGLRLGAVQMEPAAGRRAGTVVAQSPAAEVRLRQGEAVSVTIAVPPQSEP